MENRLAHIAGRIFTKALWHIPTNAQKVYLTFDDGPHPTITPWVLDLLDTYSFKATFFCIGNNIDKYPDVFNNIIKRGHTVANHSQNHLKGLKTSNKDYFSDIEKMGIHFNNTLFRPPYGKIKLSQYNYLKRKYQLVFWDVLSKDYDNNISPEKCLSECIRHTRPGSIVVFHDSDKAFKNLSYVLPNYLDYLKAKGLTSDKIIAK